MATSRARQTKSTKRLGELLLEAGVIGETQLTEALEEQKRTGKRLAQIFIERGLLAKGEAGRWLALQQGYEYVNLTSEPIDVNVAQLLPEPFVRRLMALPIRQEGKDLTPPPPPPPPPPPLPHPPPPTPLRPQTASTTATHLH